MLINSKGVVINNSGYYGDIEKSLVRLKIAIRLVPWLMAEI